MHAGIPSFLPSAKQITQTQRKEGYSLLARTLKYISAAIAQRVSIPRTVERIALCREGVGSVDGVEVTLGWDCLFLFPCRFCLFGFGEGQGGHCPVVRMRGWRRGGCGDSLGLGDTKWRMDWMDGDM